MAAVSKSEYLKRYISKADLPKKDRKKKQRKTQSSKDSKFKIIDDDFDLKHLRRQKAALDDEFNEEEPTVAEFIDERPKHVQQLEEYRKSSRWKILGDDEIDESSALDYGVIPEKHFGVQGPDHDRGTMSSRRRHDSSNSDLSPARSKPKLSKNSSNKITNRTSKRHDSDSDYSPVKKNRNAAINRSIGSSSDNSPPREKSHTSGHHPPSDSDTSPPRKTHTRSHSETSFSPKPQKSSKAQMTTNAGSSPDNSPPRRHAKRHDSGSSSDLSPQRKGKPGSSDSDESPPRKLTADSDADQSPPRRKRHNCDSSDQSPPRKKQTKQFSGKSGKDSQDRKAGSSSRHPGKDGDPSDKQQKKATKTLAGAKAGLSSANEMRDEAKKLREKEDRSFQSIGDDKLGRNAKTVVRDKETGKKRDLRAEEAKTEEEAKKLAEQKEKYKQWGKGLKQQAMKDSRLDDQVFEASKPLARFRDDKDLDEMLKKEERMEDPMLAFIRKKKEKEEQRLGKKKQKELPRYKGPAAPPNRYNIQPGYRWDGVDRSNGFEKKIFASVANKKAIQEIAYKWSTEDM